MNIVRRVYARVPKNISEIFCQSFWNWTLILVRSMTTLKKFWIITSSILGKTTIAAKKTPLRSLFVAAQKTDNCALWNLYPAIGFDLDVDGTKKLKDEIRAVQIKLSLDIIDNWPKPENDEYGIHDFVKQVLKEIANLKVERLG
mmetsp:Transcript_13716/g.15624  ORF Transcript_13716/g.15624 Transcript_13716/m.15624 type:complete len:144 (+) Transcript_13716:959-1390(+)